MAGATILFSGLGFDPDRHLIPNRHFAFYEMWIAPFTLLLLPDRPPSQSITILILSPRSFHSQRKRFCFIDCSFGGPGSIVPCDEGSALYTEEMPFSTTRPPDNWARWILGDLKSALNDLGPTPQALERCLLVVGFALLGEPLRRGREVTEAYWDG